MKSRFCALQAILLLVLQSVDHGDCASRQNRPYDIFDPKLKDQWDQLENKVAPTVQVESPVHIRAQTDTANCMNKTMLIDEIVYDEEIRCNHVTYKNCFEAYKTVYKNEINEVCRDSFNTECNIEFEDVANTETIHVCTTKSLRDCNATGEVVCSTIYQTVCETKSKPYNISNDWANCNAVNDIACFNETDGTQTCRNISRTVCDVKSKLTNAALDNKECRKEPCKVCGPEKCPVVSKEICEDKEKTFVTSVPREVCEIKPFKVCINETITLPSLQLVNECVDVPKEVCAMEKVNPKQISRPIVTLWCNNSQTSDPIKNTTPDPPKNATTHVGKWGDWDEFSECTATCGGGNKTRARECKTLAPENGGINCETETEHYTETVACNTQACPIIMDGFWSSWSQFSDCSASCGNGTQTRNRTCNNPPPDGGKFCEGDSSETIACKIADCPVNGNWGDWSSFSPCDATCGGGFQRRIRKCDNPAPAHDGFLCSGIYEELERCNPQNCPIDGNFSDWVNGSCSVNCSDETGVLTRERLCNNPKPDFGGKNCIGDFVQELQCNGPTPVQTKNDTQLCYRPYWHMIIGGSDGASLLDTVELFNWKTKESCLLKKTLPLTISEHSGTVFDGVPIFCGGFGPANMRQKGCYKFAKESRSWQNISELTVITNRAGSTQVNDQGWLIYGGFKNPLVKAQKLSNITEQWSLGPSLYNNESASEMCVIQLNDTMTVILGGSKNPRGIVYFDWTTLKYTISSSSLTKNRQRSSCAVFQGSKGEKLVAIAGGGNQGMEVWDPATGNVTQVTQELPTEAGDSTSLDFAQLLPINNGTDLLLYGGNLASERQKSIYKYSVQDNSWTPYGNMTTPRGELVVLAVPGVDCVGENIV